MITYKTDIHDTGQLRYSTKNENLGLAFSRQSLSPSLGNTCGVAGPWSSAIFMFPVGMLLRQSGLVAVGSPRAGRGCTWIARSYLRPVTITTTKSNSELIWMQENNKITSAKQSARQPACFTASPGPLVRLFVSQISLSSIAHRPHCNSCKPTNGMRGRPDLEATLISACITYRFIDFFLKNDFPLYSEIHSFRGLETACGMMFKVLCSKRLISDIAIFRKWNTKRSHTCPSYATVVWVQTVNWTDCTCIQHVDVTSALPILRTDI